MGTALVLAMALGLGACGSEDEPATPGASGGLLPVKVALTPNSLATVGVWLGAPDMLGTFKDAGVDLKLTYFSGPVPAETAGLKGDVDVVLGNAGPLMSAIAQGEKNVAVAGVTTNTQAIMARNGLNSTPGDAHALVGHTVGVNGAALKAFVQAYVQDAGLDASAVKFVTLASREAKSAALAAGQVDYVVIGDPDLSVELAAGHGTLWHDFRGSTDAIGEMPFIVAWSPGKFVTDNAKAASAFATGVCKTVAAAQADPQKAADLAAKALIKGGVKGDESDLAKQALEAIKTLNCKIDESGVQHLNDLLVTLGKAAPRTLTYDELVWSGASKAWTDAK